MLIVFGNEYKFLDHEIIFLKNKFKKIKYISNLNNLTLLDNDLLLINTLDKNIKYNYNNQISIEKFCEKYLFKVYINKDFNTPLNIHIKPFTNFQKFQKLTIDIFGIFWLLFFSWPMMIKVIFKIKQQSPNGDIIFKQNRVGENGKIFTCYKFRTMNNILINNKNKEKLKYTQDNDNRIFPYGFIMRKYRLDELPQIINILKLQMHLIAPRAEWDELVSKYIQQIPYYNLRHTIKPGITGWAQVNYPYGRNTKDAREKLMYDLYYIKYWSIWLDFKIVYKTALTVINKKGI